MVFIFWKPRKFRAGSGRARPGRPDFPKSSHNPASRGKQKDGEGGWVMTRNSTVPRSASQSDSAPGLNSQPGFQPHFQPQVWRFQPRIQPHSAPFSPDLSPDFSSIQPHPAPFSSIQPRIQPWSTSQESFPSPKSCPIFWPQFQPHFPAPCCFPALATDWLSLGTCQWELSTSFLPHFALISSVLKGVGAIRHRLSALPPFPVFSSARLSSPHHIARLHPSLLHIRA